jgi:hypothetical protein
MVVAVAAGVATLSGAALAQAPGAAAPFAVQPGNPGAFGGIVSGMMMGTIRQIDRAKNAIQVQTFGPGGAQDRWIAVAPDAALLAQGSGTLADLKENDTIVVSGVPTAITAAQIQVGMPPPFGGQRPGAFGGGPGGFGAFGGGMMARATGTVVSTKPLVVMMPDNVKLNVEASPSTRISKISRVTLADLRVGDSIRAMGQPKEDGTFTASRVEVGFEAQPGFGGFGFGPGGPGVPGAPGVPPRPNP